MEDVICPYKDKCTDYPMKCGQCIYNQDYNQGKKSHFKITHEPLESEYSPWKPEPWGD